jgi:hypothetical protein
MVRAQQSRADLPSFVAQPGPHYDRWAVIGRGGDEVVDQWRFLPAQLADHRGGLLMRLAR